MALKRKKPTSPGVRAQVLISRKHHTTTKPYKPLLTPLKGPKGRSKGTVSVRHQSRGAKKHYRIIDFLRDKKNIKAKVLTIEYDPNRNVDISLVQYEDGEKRYILRPKGLKVGDMIIYAEKTSPKVGNAMPLKNIPTGIPIHNLELQPGAGGIMVRGAGTYATILSKDSGYAFVKMPSGEVRKFLEDCYATLGQLSNEAYKNTKIGKAGRSRHMGIRPAVRGVAMSSPRQHPHGGSYKTSGIGRPSPVSPTGVPSKGYKTRKRKHTDKYKVKDRRKK
ncbi:MAG TPA: 50S ribosomal protein L2 [candidate division WWE3 bacterium]|uniref:50S ribosomal protein L2 n=1 Tax=candidate division WWE3 bacterium TaxID=2053526 RepID=A0A7V5J1C2_UNCKA|nr:50S ribosomal protein L2 [candidate division WWE3 bacterium]